MDSSTNRIPSLDKGSSRFDRFECRIAEIVEILTGTANPASDTEEPYKTYVAEVMFKEGGSTSVALWGGGIDRATKKLHGSLEPPVVGQEVLVFFPYGNYLDPLAAIPLPYRLPREENTEENPEEYQLLNRLATVQDIEHGHRTGSVLRFRQDGSVDLESWKTETSGDVESVTKQRVVRMDATEIAVERLTDDGSAVQRVVRLDGDTVTIEVNQDDGSALVNRLILNKDGTVILEQHGKSKIEMDSSGNVVVDANQDATVQSGTANDVNVLGGTTGKVSIQAKDIDATATAAGSVKLKVGINEVTVGPTGVTITGPLNSIQVGPAGISLGGGVLPCNNLPVCLFTGAPHGTNPLVKA